MRDTGIEPMSPAWKASMITTTLISLQFLTVNRYGLPDGAKRAYVSATFFLNFLAL